MYRKLSKGEFEGRSEDDGKDSFPSFHLFMFNIQPAGLYQLAKLVSVDVTEIGVGAAKHFFEAKIKAVNQSSKFEEEVCR